MSDDALEREVLLLTRELHESRTLNTSVLLKHERGLIRAEKDKAEIERLVDERDAARKVMIKAGVEQGFAEAEVKRLREALEADKTGMCVALGNILREVTARWWITEGRGDYAYDDDRYRKETEYALTAIREIAEAARRKSCKEAYAALEEE